MQDHLKPLTSLRFFAALWVVLYSYIKELNVPIGFGLIDHGYLGVDMFFILSGFILSYVYLEGFGTGRFDFFSFVNHRLARIYPLHIATLLFSILLIGAAALKGVQLDPNAQNWAALPAHLTLTQAWGLAPSASFNHPSWSISAEWFAYLSFPAVAAMAWALRNRPVVAVALAATVLVGLNLAFARLAGFSLTHATFQWGALRIVPSFLFGSALYLAWRAGAVENERLALIGAAVAGLAVVVASSFNGADVVVILGLGLLILSLAGFGRDGRGIMSSPALVYLGEISFATYMIYVPWKWVYLKAANAVLGSDHAALPFFWWLAGLLALVPLSMAAHHLIERPFRRIVRDMGENLRYRKSEKHVSLGE
ncbi:MAG: acyltransferase [Asticcacaulis sp.]|nr:acyltransferase [Asticcacaulis sp.]